MYILLVDSHVQKTILKTKKQEQSDFYFKDQFANFDFFSKGPGCTSLWCDRYFLYQQNPLCSCEMHLL